MTLAGVLLFLLAVSKDALDFFWPGGTSPIGVRTAVAASFADLRVGDQIRVIGDRSQDGARVTAEEIVSGSVSRFVGSVS